MDAPRNKLKDTTLSDGQEPAAEPSYRDVSNPHARSHKLLMQPGSLPEAGVEPSAPGRPISDASLRSLARMLGISAAKAHRRRGGSVVQIAVVLAIVAALIALMIAATSHLR